MDALRRQQSHEIFHKASLSLPGSLKQKRKALTAKSKGSNSLKAKVKSREMLGALRNIENTGGGGKPAKKLLVCGQAATALNSDLRRVLGHSPPPVPSPSHQDEIPLEEVSTKLSQGLATESVFPDSTYLSSTKAEICKIMKQSNTDTYDQLKMCCVGPNDSDHSLYCSLLSGVHTIDTVEVVTEDQCLAPPPSSPQFMIDSLPLETGPSFLLDSGPSDLLDLMDSGETDWTSPIKRPRLFPQKLY